MFKKLFNTVNRTVNQTLGTAPKPRRRKKRVVRRKRRTRSRQPLRLQHQQYRPLRGRYHL
mgnify:CR=1 FL=1